ncbi:MAG: hypothetical protein OK457_07330, partial [Thaumarchaeota archaeon]|nr:hypothetical protein [Nitrososphaerota archaeon]
EFEDSAEYIDAVLEITRAIGWGVSKLEEQENSEVVFSLSHPPSAGAESSNFLLGVVLGLTECILERKLQVSETRYDKSKNLLTVRMRRG